jgi:ABC-type Fe3+-hydroxamate transport system substrate-binding protein
MIDALGRAFDFPAPPTRVVSLVPSLTETLFDIGAGDAVAGITDFCIFPSGLERPRLGGTKNPRVEAIRALAPDLVYVNLEENLPRHAERIAEFAPVFATEPKSVADVAALIETLGAIHRRDVTTWVDRLKPVPQGGEFTFVCPIWKNPWMWCGGDTYVSSLIESVGGRNLLRDRERYPAMALDEVRAMEPQVVFLPDEPYAFTAEDAKMFDNAVGPFPGHLATWHGTRTILGLEFFRGLPLPFMPKQHRL